ncbi:hypothetical protein CACET_c05070 [Clostridium aceticum]|uniref:DUF6449 domain-containing protein n=1 Tax=Clostridium aceticum TaxID=84022 RepID=A0A0D8IE98_9CLOT|nr:DUF6449 domain-containing protein [Clostridium aceticum]AKL94017.1 hypothetical protein CACET_c05070 [Clostridium aceticum]KJF28608.1 hypothetical protein TZ02_01465 [Clostridium aceticum]
MTSKTSLFKKGLILSDIKRFWWVSVLYGLLLFFMLPLRHIMLKNAVENEWTKRQLENALNLFYYQNNVQVFLIFVVPVLMAVLVFRYMQKPNAAAMAHSLPFNRKTLYFSHSAAGLFLVAIPVTLTALMLTILQITTNLGEYYSLMNIFQWVGLTLFFNSLFFSITVFVGMFTGNSVAQIAFTYILHMLPAGVYVLYRHNLQQLLHGYIYDGVSTSIIDNLPMFVLLSARRFLSMQLLLTYGIMMLLFFIVAYYVYKIRNIEVAGDVIAFTTVQPIFKYGVATCSALLGGGYFSGFLRGGFSTMVFAYTLSSLLGYFIAEMLIQKSFKVWSTYKGYIAYLVLLLVILTGLKMDVTGYVARVPNSEDVEKVYFHYSLYPWNRFEEELTELAEAAAMEDLTYITNYFFHAEENIENIIKLHETLIENPSFVSGRSQYIIYTLKNGKHLIRQYIVDERKYASLLKPIYESEEYKRGRFPVITQKAEDIKLLEIVDYRSPKRPVVLAESAKVQELVELLQEEIQKLSFQELTFSERNAPRIIITDNNEKRMDYAIRNSYTSVIQWLKEEGFYESILLLPEDIEYVLLQKTGESPKNVEIRDPQVIEELLTLSNYLEDSSVSETILVSFYIKSSSGLAHHMDNIAQSIPVSDELRTYLNQLK